MFHGFRKNFSILTVIVIVVSAVLLPLGGECSDVLTVNFQDTMGEAGNPVASGFHGGLRDAFPDSLVEPLKPSAFRGLVIGYPPVAMDSIWVRARDLGATIIVLIDGPLDRSDPEELWWHDQWNDSDPCGDRNEKLAAWRTHVGDYVEYVKSHRFVGQDTVKVHYDIWNEPDLWVPEGTDCYGDTPTLFFDIWKAAADTIRDADPLGIVTGPSFADDVDGATWPGTSGIFMDDFLDFCLANDCMPDVLGWHDIIPTFASTDSVDNDDPDGDGRNLYAQVVYARSKIDAKGASYNLTADDFTYEINEMFDPDAYLTSGIIVRNFALAERARADDLGLDLCESTYWCDPCADSTSYYNCTHYIGGSPQEGKLGGTVNPSFYCGPYTHHRKRYAWWAHKAYADIQGIYVRPYGDASLDAVAGIDVASGTAKVLVGRYAGSAADSVRIRFQHIIQDLVVNEAIHLRGERIFGAAESTLVSYDGLAPEVVLDSNVIVEGDSLVVTFSGSEFPPGDAMILTLERITPEFTIAPGTYGDNETAIQATEVGNTVVIVHQAGGAPWEEGNIHLKNGVRVIVADEDTIAAVVGSGDSVLVFPENANAFTTVEGLPILGGDSTKVLVTLRGKGGLRNCSILANSSNLNYGYGVLVDGGTGFIDSCTVDLSNVSGPCDGIYVQTGTAEIGHTSVLGSSHVTYGIEGGSASASHAYDCTVLGTGTGIRVRGTMTVEHSTVEGCSAYGIYGDDSHTSLVTNCIAANTGQASIQMTYASQTVNYSIGEQGVIIYTGTGNKVEDPLFCGTGDYTLRADSYGNPDNNPSGEQIGAYPVACLFGSLARDVSWDGSKPALPVLGDVTVSSARTLTLTSGARLEFAKGDNQGSGSDYEKSELIINGMLEIDGGGVVLTSGASPDSAGDWWGVHVGGTATIDSVTVEDAVYGVYFDDGAGSLTHSTLQNNDNADVMCANTYSGPVLIEDNMIHAHGARGIFLNYADSVTVRGNTITNNPPIGIDISGLTVVPFHEILIEGNTIQGGTPKVNKGIKMYGEGPKFRGNTIKDWQYGVYIEAGGPVFGIQDSSGSGDLITNNQVGVLASGDTAEVIIRECDIVNGSTGVITRSAGTVDLGTGLHGQNVKRGNNNLSGNSTYCIWNRNTGDEYLLAHFNYFGPCSEGGIPPLCWEGNVEVDGALCTAPASVSLGRELVKGEPKGLLVGGFAPNPLRGDGQIYFSLQEGVGKPSVQVYDVAGRLVWDFVGTEVGPGEHRIPWDAVGKAGQRLVSGMYFIRVVVGDERQTVKVLVTR